MGKNHVQGSGDDRQCQTLIYSYSSKNDPAIKFGKEVVGSACGFLEKDTAHHQIFQADVSCMGCCCIGGGGDDKLAALILLVLAAAASIGAAICAASSFAEVYKCNSDICFAETQLSTLSPFSSQAQIYHSSISALHKKQVERVGAGFSQVAMAGGFGLLSVALVMVLLEADALALPLALPGLGLAGGGVVLYCASSSIFWARRESRDPVTGKTDLQNISDQIKFLEDQNGQPFCAPYYPPPPTVGEPYPQTGPQNVGFGYGSYPPSAPPSAPYLPYPHNQNFQ